EGTFYIRGPAGPTFIGGSRLRLYRDPRSICFSMLDRRQGGHVADFRIAFLERWARLYFRGETEVYESVWLGFFDQIIRDDLDRLVAHEDIVVQNLLIRIGVLEPGRLSFTDPAVLVMRCFDEPALGVVVDAAIRTALHGKAGVVDQEILARFGAHLRRKRIRVPQYVARMLEAELTAKAPWLPDLPADRATGDDCHIVLLWISLLCSEVLSTGLSPFHDVVEKLLPRDLLLQAIRLQMKTSRTNDDSAEELRELRYAPRSEVVDELRKVAPPWVARWALSQASLLF
ncbi:hypothetical protein ACFHWS_19095, partial [Micromonospora sp. LOL_013]|uniref:hypothetical protein n=1 Tax=Micromonospora sp. LOL_013 TaxID=3345414 RepID=UPI003A848DBE